MPCVKTAVSIEESLFREADQLAREMKVSRSKLVAQAIREYLARRRAEELTRKIREAYADFPDEEDEAFFRLANASAARLTEDDGW